MLELRTLVAYSSVFHGPDVTVFRILTSLLVSPWPQNESLRIPASARLPVYAFSALAALKCLAILGIDAKRFNNGGILCDLPLKRAVF
jgi:hypothetical protein